LQFEYPFSPSHFPITKTVRDFFFPCFSLTAPPLKKRHPQRLNLNPTVQTFGWREPTVNDLLTEVSPARPFITPPPPLPSIITPPPPFYPVALPGTSFFPWPLTPSRPCLNPAPPLYPSPPNSSFSLLLSLFPPLAFSYYSIRSFSPSLHFFRPLLPPLIISFLCNSGRLDVVDFPPFCKKHVFAQPSSFPFNFPVFASVSQALPLAR